MKSSDGDGFAAKRSLTSDSDEIRIKKLKNSFEAWCDQSLITGVSYQRIEESQTDHEKIVYTVIDLETHENEKWIRTTYFEANDPYGRH